MTTWFCRSQLRGIVITGVSRRSYAGTGGRMPTSMPPAAAGNRSSTSSERARSIRSPFEGRWRPAPYIQPHGLHDASSCSRSPTWVAHAEPVLAVTQFGHRIRAQATGHRWDLRELDSWHVPMGQHADGCLGLLLRAPLAGEAFPTIPGRLGAAR